jgi:asparagine N-glycosylation enzyme membrane subunit Stt3
LSTIDHSWARLAAITKAGREFNGEETDMLGTILIVILVLALVGALPTWPHSRNWGYYPTGGLGLVLVIVLVLLVLGRI